MTTTPQDVAPLDPETAAAPERTLGDRARDHLWLHFTRHSSYDAGAVPVMVKGDGAYVWDDRGAPLPRRPVGAVRRAGRARPHASWRRPRRRRPRRSPSSRCGPTPTPMAVELADRLAQHTPGDLNRVFFTTGGGEAVETRLEARQAVLQAHRQAGQAQGDQPGGGLPRHPAGRARDHRHPGGQGAVRAARARRVQGAQHQLLPRARAVRRRREGVRPVGGRADRERHRVRGPRHRRRRVPRAGAELRRLLPAAARLLRAGPRDLRPSTTCCSCPTR